MRLTFARYTVDDHAGWLTSAAAVLTRPELEHVEAITDPDARVQHAVGRAMIRLSGAASSGHDPKALTISVSAEGKPELADVPGLHVSTAHVSGLVVTAASTAAAVGVDAERAAGVSDPQRIAQRLFADSEVAWLREVPERERAAWFVRVWALKEAVGKALGVGMVPAWSGAIVSLGPAGLALTDVWAGPPAAQWSVHQLSAPGGDERVAVALPAPGVVLGPISDWTLDAFARACAAWS